MQNVQSQSTTVLDKQIPNGLECPITGAIMRNPVLAADNLTYEEEAIREWFSRGHNTSPLTRAVLADQNLRPNITVRKIIDDYISHHPEKRVDLYNSDNLNEHINAMEEKHGCAVSSVPSCVIS